MSFRDQVLNHPRSGLSLSEAKTRRDHLANLPPELFEMAEQAAGTGASWSAKLKALVVGMQSLLDSLQKAEAAAPTSAAKPSPASTQIVHKGSSKSDPLK